MSNESQDNSNRFTEVLEGLERLAGNLDNQRYPGPAWPAAVRQRRRVWRIPAAWLSLATTVAVAAAITALYCQLAPPRPSDRLPGDKPVMSVVIPANGQVAKAPRTASLPAPAAPEGDEPPGSRILIVEDIESYSVIDMTSDVPLVWFATKDADSPVCVVPLPAAPPRGDVKPAI
jgi:hypothetical protein